jgi:Predicted membrane-bound mannosyltransferase
MSKLVNYGRKAMAREDTARLAVAAMVLLSVGFHTGLIATAAYETGQPGEPLVHSAQPVDDLEGMVSEMEAAVGDQQDANARVVWVGGQVHTEANLRSPPLTSGAERAVFAERLPLAYYLERAQLPVSSVSRAEGLTGDPAVVISVPSEAGVVAGQLPNHERHSVQVASDRELVVFLPERSRR